MVEYLVRGLGYIESQEDIRQTVVAVNNNVPVRIMDIARVDIGPAVRNMTGILDKGGEEAGGGVVVARYGENPLHVIQNVKDKIEEISSGLPSRELAYGTTSQVTIVPFYDRTQLIYETLGTLNDAIILQILISIIVIIVMVYHLRTSLLISALLPIAVLMSFIMMRYFGVDANIVALSGIAISIGTMVDLGIIMNENILRHLQEAKDNARNRLEIIYKASTEVAPAILTAVSGVFAIDAAAQLRSHYSMMAPPERADIPEPFKSNLEKLFHIYFDLKNALADDAPEKAREHGQKLKEQLATTGKHSLDGEHHMFWMAKYEDMEERKY